MKKILALVVLLSALKSYSQEVELKDLKVPTAPAFSILDFSPKVIESPGTIKAFTTSILSNTAESAGLPRNFAFEFAPYWFFRHPNMNVYKYFGLSAGGSSEKDLSIQYRPNIFYGLRSTSISFGSVFRDSSDQMPVDINYIGYALRSNVINIKHPRINKALFDQVGKVNEALQNSLIEAITACAGMTDQERLDCIGNFISSGKDSLLTLRREEFLQLLNVRPVFSVDIALASSTAFARNNWKDHNAYRSGGWISLGYYKPLVSGSKVDKDLNELIKCRNYLNAVLMLRYLQQNSTVDFVEFTKNNMMDIGGRIEFEFDRFALSVEAIRRFNNTNDDLDTHRAVGILQYRINDNLFLLGTFGRDFGNSNNLVSLIGLNWGLGKNSLFNRFE